MSSSDTGADRIDSIDVMGPFSIIIDFAEIHVRMRQFCNEITHVYLLCNLKTLFTFEYELKKITNIGFRLPTRS